jgi:integrase
MLSATVQRHVALMRTCGFVFDKQAGLLTGYAAFAEARGDTHVRTATVLDWSRRVGTHAQRRTVYLTVRRFALTAVAEDARHEVPPPDLLPQTARQRPAPYIYASEQIAALVAVADRAASRRCRVLGQCRLLFGLIASTGMRISEALGLDTADVTPDGLLIREAKLRARRLLPLHPSVAAELTAHLVRRVRVPDASDAIFLGDRGGRLGQGAVRSTFGRMLALTGLEGVARDGRNPRIHDLRHTFAVRSLEACAAERGAVARHMVALSSWLGHVNIVDTYWYLEGTPRLLGQIADRTKAFAAGMRS